MEIAKAVHVVGLFSMFDAELQRELSCRNGFQKASFILEQENLTELNNQFDLFKAAVNVLKHGKGRSYDELIIKSDFLPFRIKLPDENFFFEGDVSEVSTLIEVNNKFVKDCVELINSVSKVIREHRH